MNKLYLLEAFTPQDQWKDRCAANASLRGGGLSYPVFFNKILYTTKILFLQVFKGFDRIKEIQHVYTNEMSSMCGTRLGRGQYLNTPDGIFVTLCNNLALWDRLSLIQKNNIENTYLMGCNCTVIKYPCKPSTKNECILTNLSSLWSFKNGEPILESACIRHSDGSCGWYEGAGKPSENDTMNVSGV
uniref:TIMP metallopeptidase inhibitor 4, tandem duplicate 1 n=1 Tax=Cyprinus carpio TaxID=7962 RepID=A0A8C1KWU2_CYPCA